MSALRGTSRTARTASLLSLGAFAVHQLRYLLAYGHQTGQALAHQGHGYLSDGGGVAAALALATLLATLLAGVLAPNRRAGEPAAVVFRRTAGPYALALLAIFCVQELIEGAVAVGHPAGFAAVLAHGGWVSLPLALAIGAVCSLVTLALQGVERTLARTASRPRPTRPAVSLARPPVSPYRSPLVALNLGFGFARRPPPLLLTG